MAAPKAFISHTSDDKNLWARPLAQKLRALGVESWFDEWEIKAGDSIVQKVFSSGIEEADAFVVVLSKTSVNKEWVKAELDVAVVRKIDKLMRLIPVRVDDCVMPTSLIATRYLTIDHRNDIDSVAKEIANTLHGVITAPPVGPAPSYVRDATIELPGVTPLASTVLETAYSIYINDVGLHLDLDPVYKSLEEEGVDIDQANECLELLESHGWLVGEGRGLARQPRFRSITFAPHAVLALAGYEGFDVSASCCLVANTLLNSGRGCNLDHLIDTETFPRLHLWAILKTFANHGFVFWSARSRATLGTVTIKNQALLRAWSRENCA